MLVKGARVSKNTRKVAAGDWLIVTHFGVVSTYADRRVAKSESSPTAVTLPSPLACELYQT